MGNEWYTPIEYVEAVMQVLGEIDLDPASCEHANKTVKARRYYSKADNGLMHPWHGRMFLNPPYGKTLRGGGSNLESFTRYLIEQFRIGNVTEAILLIPDNLATSWYLPLWEYPICFPPYRIRFDTENGKSDGAAFGSCFIYMGKHEPRFIDVFSQFGPVIPSGSAIFRRKPAKLELWSA